MKFNIDVLIIYAEKDNIPIQKNSASWIFYFTRFFQILLKQRSIQSFRVEAKSEIDADLSKMVTQSAVVIAVLSKNFISSAPCMNAVKQYSQQSSSDVALGRRVFKVFKEAISFDHQPDSLQELIGYYLYQEDSDSGKNASEYENFFTPDAEKRFWMNLMDLAYDVHKILLSVQEDMAKTTAPISMSSSSKKSIYMAETEGYDVISQYNLIRRELMRYKYNVLPDLKIPYTQLEAEKHIRENLKQSEMSIHLVGSSYGKKLAGSDVSLVELQNQIASEHVQEQINEGSIFTRMIWIPSDLKTDDEQQIAFISRLKRDAEFQVGAEILQGPIEDFKILIRRHLISPHYRMVSNGKNKAVGKKAFIYLLYDKIDQDQVQPYREIIKEEGYNLLEPSFDTDLIRVNQQHIQNLRNFDAAILFSDKVSEQWVRVKTLDLLKAPGFGRTKKIRGRAILSHQEVPHIQGINDEDVVLITKNNFRNFIKKL